MKGETAMDRKEATGWVLTVCSGLRLSQAKTLGELVPAAMRVGRVSLAEIGRALTSDTAAKHRIKRVWRFTSNRRIVVSDAMQGVVARLLKRHKKKPLLVALDWTEIRNVHTLMAAAVMRGRAVPLLWASYPEWELHKSQNNLEEGLLRLLRTMIPASVKVILLADRGFGRTEIGRLCQELGFHYVIRIRPDVWVRADRFRGKLLDYPVKKGICRMLRRVEYRKQNPIEQHVVVRWKRGLPKRRDECWFLMTDLDQSPLRLSELYGRRMTVEELFRDDKNRRNGFALRNTQIQRADRIDRLLLILALAYILLVGIGLRAQRQYPPAVWCSSNDPRQCSVFTIGRILVGQLQIPLPLAVAAVLTALVQAAPNWG
jgi:hypothetical protein